MSTKNLLVSVLFLLSLLSGWLLHLLGQSVSDQTVGWLKSLSIRDGLVHQTETRGLSSTEVGSETEHGDGIFVSLVDLGQSLTELILGDVSLTWVVYVNDKLNSSKKRVLDDLSGSNSNGVTLQILLVHRTCF